MGRRRKLWRYSTGNRGINRVTAYEREDSSSLYLEWWDPERNQVSMRTLIGTPVPNSPDGRKLAKRVAHELADRLEQKRVQQAARALFGELSNHTLGELLDRLHASPRAQRWSERYDEDQRRFKRFWEEHLGRDVLLTHVTPEKVERVVEDVGADREWSPRTRQAYLRYIVDATRYGQVKLKWLDERHNLSAVTMPKPKSKTDRLVYSEDEAMGLLDALHEVDERAGAVGEVAYLSGRRLSAILKLRTDDFREAEIDGHEVGIVTFRDDDDKANRRGEVVLVGRALDAVRRVAGEEYLFESGDSPVTRWKMYDHLLAAEELAGITHNRGRAWHGLKRRFATDAQDRRAASAQSGTNEEMLEGRYEQDELQPKVELAVKLAERRGA